MFAPENAVSGQANGAPTVPAVTKAFRLLAELSSAGEPLGVSELSRRLGMGKSTVHGLVTTLASLGVLAVANGSKRYRIGPSLHTLVARAAGDADVRSLARPSLERLAAESEQTSFLGVPSGGQIVILDLVHGRPTMSVSAAVGSSIPLIAGAAGKAVLSALAAAQRRAHVDSAPAMALAKHGIVDREAYLQTLEECKAKGWATDVDEQVDGMRAAAAAVLGAAREPVAVIWVAGFSRHIDRQRLESIAASVAREAGVIGARLGGRAS